MKKSRFTDSQIIAVLKQAESGTPAPELQKLSLTPFSFHFHLNCP